MCHGWVKLIIRMDRKKVFRFSPLHGEMAQKLLKPILPDYVKEDTIVFYDVGKIALRSDAVLKIFEALGFPYNLGIVGYILPKKWRDGGYRWVAKQRYRYGRRYNSCPLPPEEWKDRFI